MKHLEHLASIIFGATFLLLSIAVALETGLRKIANISLQGVDELGGYCLAVGTALAFAVTLVSGAHIRIDLVHDRLPRALRVALNALAIVSLAVVAVALAWMARLALGDSMAFNSTAQTPWATPLRIPQAVWVGALAIFVAVALILTGRLVMLMAARRWNAIDREMSPRGSEEELADELADLAQRGIADPGKDPGR